MRRATSIDSGRSAPGVDESMVQARQRSDKGLIPPRFILTATIAQMKQFVSGTASENPFVTAYAAKLDQIAELSPAQRAEMKATATRIVEQQIVPAWLRVVSYLESLVPRSTDAAGLSRLPGGREAYAYRLRNFTTTDLTADEIHALGLKQVAVLEAEMDVILKGMGRATGTVPSRIAQLKKEQAYPLTEEGRAAIMAGWLARREREVVAYLIEENRCLRRQLSTRRLRLTDDDRRRLAARAYRSAGVPYATSPRSPRPTRYCGGTGTSLRGNGRAAVPRSTAVRSWLKSVAWWSGWRKRTRRGAIRGCKAR